MFKNYIQIAWRNIVKRKAYSLLNITGLAIGIASCLVLFTVLRYEMSYDDFYPSKERIYHIATKDKLPDDVAYTSGIPYPALDAIRLDFPNIITGALVGYFPSQVTVLGTNSNNTNNEKKFIEEGGVFYADPEFFEVFQHKWLTGTPAVLKEPNVVVLTKKMAEKYFGNWKDAVGQYLKSDNAIVSKVAGIIETPLTNTDFPLAIVGSYATVKSNPGVFNYSTDWGSTTSNFQLFVKLPQGVNEADINKQLLAFSKKNYRSSPTTVRTNWLQPLNEVHFDTRLSNYGDHVTNKSTIWTLALIGLFILIMACINFINLSTAQSVGRSKEVGIRKVLGSNRKQLFWQILGETAIIVIIAVLLALGIAFLVMPSIKHIASISETLGLLNAQTLLFLLAVTVIVTILSGIYPSLVISRFNPTLALKNKINSATVGGISLRRALVVVQFAISQVLIIGTIVAISQMNYVQNADLGFNKESVLLLNATADSVTVGRQQALKQRLQQLPGVQAVSFSTDVPSSENFWGSNMAFDHKDDENFTLFLKFGDEDYFKTYGLQLVAGRKYSKSDTLNEVVVNETLVRKLGVKDPQQVIGKEIRVGRSPWRTIVGVLKDFKTSSLRQELQPIMLGERNQLYSVTGVKFKTSNPAQMQETVQKVWNDINPEYAFTSSFLDENINNFYRQEQQLSLLYKLFAGIAIVISCLGLYGLVSFMAAQRRKEVGIRKVLGASVANIIYLFSKEFTLLIMVAFVIAVPVAYYLMSGWLQGFVFRVKMGVGVFALAILASVIVAWLTVGYKSLKSALANPVKNLRAE